MDVDKTVTKARVALGGVAPTSLRMKAAESYLVGKKINDETIEKAAEIAAEGIKPITDLRGTAEYRKEMVYVGMKNMIRAAANRIV